MADFAQFQAGSRPQVLINWDTFVTWGIDTNWRDPFTDAVINACARWAQLSGVDCRHQFAGYTTKTSADSGEVVITMNEHHFMESRIASTFGTNIVFHRKDGATLTPWNFVPYQANAGEIDMQGVLMHELGHTFWLDHSPNAQD